MIQRHVIFFSLLGMILVIGLLSYLGGDGQILMLCMVSLLYLIEKFIKPSHLEEGYRDWETDRKSVV